MRTGAGSARPGGRPAGSGWAPAAPEVSAGRQGSGPGGDWSWVDLQNAAFDGNRDGYSARATTRIHQWYGGRWVHTHNLTTATASAGAGTSNRQPAQRVPRVNGASHMYISTTICAYDVPRALNVNCATRNSIAISWTS